MENGKKVVKKPIKCCEELFKAEFEWYMEQPYNEKLSFKRITSMSVYETEKRKTEGFSKKKLLAIDYCPFCGTKIEYIDLFSEKGKHLSYRNGLIG